MKPIFIKVRLTFLTAFLLLLIAFIPNNSNAQTTLQLSVPANGSTWESTTPKLYWLLYNTYTTVNFSVQLGLSANNFSNPYLIVNTTVSGNGVGIYDVPTGLLAVGVTYYWRIGYNGNYSSVYSFTPATGSSGYTPVVLIPPILISPSSGSINTTLNPTFNWSQVNGATSYEIQVSQQSNFSVVVSNVKNIQATTVALNSLLSGTNYYWRVRAVNNVGVSNWCSPFSFTTRPQLPPVPTLIIPANNTNGTLISLSLNWNRSQFDSAYNVLVSTNAEFTNIIANVNTTTNSTVVSNLLYSTTYYWKVRGVNFTGTGTWSSVFNFTTKSVPPIPPSAISPTNITSIPINFLFKWIVGSPATGVNFFKLEISKSATFSSNVLSFTNLTETEKMVTGLTPLSLYYWRVKLYTQTDSSDWSAIIAFNTRGDQRTIYVDVNNGADVAISPNLPAGDGSLLRPYKTINRAFQALLAGILSGTDTIRVASGAYPEVLNVNFPVIIIGSANTQIAALNIGNGNMPLPDISVVVRNIECSFFPAPFIPGGVNTQGIRIDGFNNVLLEKVKVANYNTANGLAALMIVNGQSITITNSDFSNNVRGIFIASSRNITLSNVSANHTPPQAPTQNVRYGLYVENTKNIAFADLIFDSNDVGMLLKHVSNGIITNLRITNSGWLSNNVQSTGALVIGASSSLTFNNGQINQNKTLAVIVDPTNQNIILQVFPSGPSYPNQNSFINSIDNLKFTGMYEFKNNFGGILFFSEKYSLSSSVNSPQFDGTFIFSDNAIHNSIFTRWQSTDLYISGSVKDLYVKGAQFINSVPYPNPYMPQPLPPTSQATTKAVLISNSDTQGIQPIPVGSQPIRAVFNNCTFDQSIGVPNIYIENQTPNKVNAHNNYFAYAASQMDVENMIIDSLDTVGPNLFQKFGRVDFLGSTFGSKLPPTISVASLPVSYRGASYYLPVNIVTKGNSYNFLKGKFFYDATKLHYNGYLSNASGLINQKNWTTLSVSNTVTLQNSGIIEFIAFGNSPIETNGTLFKLNMQVLSNAPVVGQPGVAFISGNNADFLGNNQPVFTYNQSVISYTDPNGIVQAKGDINLDGVVNMDDFMAVLYHLLGLQIVTDTQALSNADFNNDNLVNQTDLNALFVFLNPGSGIVSPSIVSGNVTIPQVSISDKLFAIIPVSLVNARNVSSFQFVINYDPNKIKFQSFSNALNLGDQYIHGMETKPGEAVFHVQSPSFLNGTVNFGELRLSFGNNSIPVGTVVKSKYILNGGEQKNGPSFTFNSNGVTEIEKETKIPSEFSLSQNYPNPFNPETTINFSIPNSGHVTLKVYDILGRAVATLVDEHKQAGTYSASFNTLRSSLTSGVYLYRLQSGSYNETKKLILMK